MLQSFTDPTLIINGENDKLNRKRGTELLKVAQDGQLQILEKAGHLYNLEQPETFSQLVRQFANRLSQHCS